MCFRLNSDPLPHKHTCTCGYYDTLPAIKNPRCQRFGNSTCKPSFRISSHNGKLLKLILGVTVYVDRREYSCMNTDSIIFPQCRKTYALVNQIPQYPLFRIYRGIVGDLTFRPCLGGGRFDTNEGILLNACTLC